MTRPRLLALRAPRWTESIHSSAVCTSPWAASRDAAAVGDVDGGDDEAQRVPEVAGRPGNEVRWWISRSPYRSGASGTTATTLNVTDRPSTRAGRVPPEAGCRSRSPSSRRPPAPGPWKSSRLPFTSAQSPASPTRRRGRRVDLLALRAVADRYGHRPGGRRPAPRPARRPGPRPVSSVWHDERRRAAGPGRGRGPVDGEAQREHHRARDRGDGDHRSGEGRCWVRTAERTSSRASRAVTSRRANGRASSPARARKTSVPTHISPMTTTSGSSSGGDEHEQRLGTPGEHRRRDHAGQAAQGQPATCTTPGRRRSRDASRRAAMRRSTREARLDERHEPSSATPVPAPAATAQAIQGAGSLQVEVGETDGPDQPQHHGSAETRTQPPTTIAARTATSGRLAEHQESHLSRRRADEPQEPDHGAGSRPRTRRCCRPRTAP